MKAIAPCLWFDGQAEQAANFYVSLFPNSSIDKVNRSTVDYPGGKKGDALLIAFTLDGRPYQALNGGPFVKFNEAISLSLIVETQAELDRLWDALIADGGAAVQCSWLKDRWGLSWQVVPQQMFDMMGSSDTAAAQRAMEAMMQMVKLDIATLEAAFEARTAA